MFLYICAGIKEINIFMFGVSKIVPRLMAGEEIKRLQSANKKALKKQLKDLSKFAQKVPEFKASQDALEKSLEKLAQTAKRHI